MNELDHLIHLDSTRQNRILEYHVDRQINTKIFPWDLQKNVLTFLGILTTKSFIPLTQVEISGVKIEPYIFEL